MGLLQYLQRKAKYLNEPQLVADFQALCKIEISGKDSGLSTADDETDNASDSSEGQESSSGVSCDENTNDPITNKDHLINDIDSDSSLPFDDIETSEPSRLRNGKVRNRSSRIITKDNEDALRNKLESSIAKNVAKYSMENNVSFKINNYFLYYLFNIGSALGNEAFYCYFFPYWYWNVDGYVCRRVVLVWAITMYLGQMAKDIIRWPRPSSPPVAKLEQRYELEYGMPSTHSMISFAIPFSLLVLTMERYVYSWTLGIIGAVLWCLLVSLSRAYLGMHSFLDIICGLLTGMVLTPLTFLFLDAIDDFQVTHPYAPFVMFSACLILALVYPQLDKWSTARGDTTLILGVEAGMAIASWCAYQQGMYHRPTESPPYIVKIPDMEFVLSTIVRMALGGTILMATRATMKFVLTRVLCFIHGFDRHDANIKKHLKFELPYKFIAYGVVAFNVAYTAPFVFRCLGVERITFFTDL